jgi:tRNA uracil 4-sulfurtransferase
MDLILLRYGEIALKGQNRAYFMRKLRRNVRLCLKANGLEGRVWQEGQRIYVETGELEAALQALQRVFGIVSLSPVKTVANDLPAITDEALAVAQRAGLDASQAFRITVRRADKAFPLPSPEIARRVGAAVVAATGARVHLRGDVDLEIGVEIRPERCLVFGQTFAGPGGYPVGSQGRVVALLSSGIDSPVAAWLMMKRGCSVIPVHFAASEAQAQQVQALVAALDRYAYGWRLRPIILSHEQAVGPVLDRLAELRRERWACLFCRRALLAQAVEIAHEHGAAGLVTGESLGQVASQTLSNLEITSYGIEKPILRPLIGLDKTEIADLARRIGTYDLSTRESHPCPYLPNRPLTQARMADLKELLAEIEGFPLPSSEQDDVRSQHA